MYTRADFFALTLQLLAFLLYLLPLRSWNNCCLQNTLHHFTYRPMTSKAPPANQFPNIAECSFVYANNILCILEHICRTRGRSLNPGMVKNVRFSISSRLALRPAQPLDQWRGFFHRRQTGRSVKSPLTSNYCCDKENVDLYIHNMV
jgi:hypothetical protein